MFEIETKELKISDEPNRKIEMICRFACFKYEFIPGNIKSIKNINIAYAKPHILKVKRFFGSILKNKYKDVADDLREANIKTKKEYNKIYDLPIRKGYKEDKNKDDFEL